MILWNSKISYSYLQIDDLSSLGFNKRDEISERILRARVAVEDSREAEFKVRIGAENSSAVVETFALEFDPNAVENRRVGGECKRVKERMCAEE